MQVRKDSDNSFIPLDVDERYHWLITSSILESSPLGRVIKYVASQWLKFIRYLDDGHLSIDNNLADHAIKPLVIFRKTGFSPILKWC
ncbi:transposase [Vibrio panuliri]|nr:transposase [Vibrio panuliri]